MAKTGYVGLSVDQWEHWLWNPVPDVQAYFSPSVAVYKAIAGVGRRMQYQLSDTDPIPGPMYQRSKHKEQAHRVSAGGTIMCVTDNAGREDEVKLLLTRFVVVLEVQVDEFQLAMEQGSVRPCTNDGFVVRNLDLSVEKHLKVTRMDARLEVEALPSDVPVDKPAFVFYKISDDVTELSVVKKLLANSINKPRGQKRPSSTVGGGTAVDVRLSYYGVGMLPAGLLHYDESMSPDYYYAPTLPQMGVESVAAEYKVMVQFSNKVPVGDFVKLKNLETLKEYMYQNDKELEELNSRSSTLLAIQKKLVAEMDEMLAKESVVDLAGKTTVSVEDLAGKTKQPLVMESVEEDVAGKTKQPLVMDQVAESS
ncbi:unnamed protein product [Symbiodinium sp. CCMP2592]|nr:unnamed protein product [Symbiodinium sp. CCMP2592]CAE7470539.1 unnamed protein product [Symbiodinium sp. CCMP2592]CAE7754148.1 unnamed protein product [Symbiodinium sp. CCMP2592]CAE7832200.1 unnamed protein product [Symbiodinium sp. CCMP2592]